MVMLRPGSTAETVAVRSWPWAWKSSESPGSSGPSACISLTPGIHSGAAVQSVSSDQTRTGGRYTSSVTVKAVTVSMAGSSRSGTPCRLRLSRSGRQRQDCAAPRSDPQAAFGGVQVAGPAQGFVPDVLAVDGDLLAVEYDLLADPAGVEHCLAAAAADGLEFLEGVGDLQQAPGPREGLGAEVRADAVGQHRHVVQHGDAEEVIHLLRLQELGLVHQQAGHRLDLDMLEQRIRVVARGDLAEVVP